MKLLVLGDLETNPKKDRALVGGVMGTSSTVVDFRWVRQLLGDVGSTWAVLCRPERGLCERMLRVDLTGSS